MSGQGYYFRDRCRLCDAKDLVQVIELTPTPPGNHFVTASECDVVQDAYPLEVYFCSGCTHVQLGHVVDPEILYRRNYSYVSGTSRVFVEHLRRCADQIVRNFRISPGGLVVDIGSNDGTALSFYKNSSFRVVGIDPATEIAKLAVDRGIDTICEFFTARQAALWRANHGPAELIVSHNALAHIDDLRDVVEGVKCWLDADGIFVMEVGYLLDVYENAWFDTIYHEHLDYHSVKPLVQFFASLGMQVIDVQRVSPQGGSIRLVSQKAGGSRQVSESVSKLISLEKQRGLTLAETFVNFGKRIDTVKIQLREIVNQLKSEGMSIAGYGAPTKATTLLMHFDLGDALDFLVDDNPLKQGMFSPGAHIPVLAAEMIYENRPDFVLILAWNFAESIMEKHQRYRELGGRFILPMPEPCIVS